MTSIPDRYPNPKNDDPWDNDAVQWLLEQPGGAAWSRHDLTECLRHQPRRLREQPTMVSRAEAHARRYGVKWVKTPRGNGIIYRLYRTDPDAPAYPQDEDERRRIRKS